MAGAPTCTESAPYERDVWCELHGDRVEETRCSAGTRPERTTRMPRYEGCTIDWAFSNYSNWSSYCSNAATRTRDVQCTRYGGDSTPIPPDETLCTKEKPDRTEVAQVFSSCTYEWEVAATGNWSSSCSPTATRTLTHQCRRSTGALVPDLDAEKYCGARPDEVETAERYSGCSGTWEPTWTDFGSCTGGKQTQKATFACTRNGSTVEDYECTNATLPSDTQTVDCSPYTGTWVTGSYAPSGYCDKVTPQATSRPVTCSTGKSADCDPAIKPKAAGPDQVCTVKKTCGTLQIEYSGSGTEVFTRNITMATSSMQAVADRVCPYQPNIASCEVRSLGNNSQYIVKGYSVHSPKKSLMYPQWYGVEACN